MTAGVFEFLAPVEPGPGIAGLVGLQKERLGRVVDRRDGMRGRRCAGSRTTGRIRRGTRDAGPG